MCFFTGSLIWHHTHTHTHKHKNTPGVDRGRNLERYTVFGNYVKLKKYCFNIVIDLKSKEDTRHSYLFVILQLKHINDNLRTSDHAIVNPFSTC